MRTRTMWLAVAVAAALMLAAGGAGALAEPTSPEVVLANKINYQGRLTDPGGAPLTGTFPMRFQIYTASSGGTMLWDSGVISVDVDHGLFNVGLIVNPANFNGQALWLRIYVNGEWLTPRQELLPVPYALSLRPGAEVVGDSAGDWILKAKNIHSPATGSALWGEAATGSAVYGNSTGGYGLLGYSQNGNALVARSGKTAGIFESDNGYGIQVSAFGTDTWDHGGTFAANWGWGIYAKSVHNHAIRAEAGDISGLWQGVGQVGVVAIGEDRGVYGSSGTGVGVYGISRESSGVYGETESDDSAVAAGIWGYKGSSGGDAVRGLKYGDWGRAIYGTNWSSSGSGVVGESTNYMGAWGETARSDHNYGLYTPDNIWSLNYHLAGAVMQAVQNGGSESLEPGDVVSFSGMAPPLEENGPPVVQVTKVSTANSTAIAGVVYRRFNSQMVSGTLRSDGQGTAPDLEITSAGPVAPGEYLLLVVHGPAQVKASALAGPIQPGDLLSGAELAGHAARSAQVTIEGIPTALPGTVLGKALETLEAGEKLIYIFVTLQ